MQSLFALQRTFFNTHQTKDVSFRISQLKTFKKALQAYEPRLYDAIYRDFKKSEFDAFTTEIALLYKEIEDALNSLKQWAKPKKVATNWINFPAKSYILSEPYGVCLIIGAWNYPYQLSLGPAIAAMAAGNTIIVKPSELPSETAKVMHEMIAAYFPKEYFAIVEGGVSETTELLNQPFDKIFFTGSTRVGKIVYSAAAKNLTPVTLELGGKSPAFVTESCQLERTVQRLIWGKFLNAGQTCIAPDYVMVHKSIHNAFLQACEKEITKRKYAFENHNYVQIINDDHFQRLQKLINPTKLYFGGKMDKDSRYIQPTILNNVGFEDAVMQEEIFGPILPVISYDILDDAIEQVLQLPKPLSCYVFTTKASERKKVHQKLSFGGGAVNDVVMHISNPNLPFGGVGQSGIGSYHGEAGFLAFSHQKSILHKANWLELPLKYSPLSAKKLWWIKQFFKL